MDSLDLNVHSAILTSLAQCYATSSANEEPVAILAKLSALSLSDGTSKSSEPSDHSNQPETSNSTSSVEIKITDSQAHYIIAYAAYISQSAVSRVSVSSAEIQQLCDMIRNLVHWSIELNISTENAAEWPIIDEITYRLVLAMLEIGLLSEPVDREKLVGALGAFITELGSGLFNGSPIRIVTHFLPCLSGLRRALGSGFFPFTTAHLNQLFSSTANSHIFSLSAPSKEHVESALAASSESNLTDYHRHQIDHFKARYFIIGFPLSPSLIVFAGLQQYRNCLEQCLVSVDLTSSNEISETDPNDGGWAHLKQSASAKTGIGFSSDTIHDINSKMTVLFEEYYGIHQQELETGSPDDYTIKIICEIIKLSCVCAVILDNVSDQVFDQMLMLHTEEAIIIHPAVQIAASESLIVLARNFPDLLDKITETLRTYVSSTIPPPEIDTNHIDEACPSLLAAAHALAVCLELKNSPDFTQATIYALVNHVNTTQADLTLHRTHDVQKTPPLQTPAKERAESISLENQGLVSINALSTLLILLEKVDQDDLNSTIAPMLLLCQKGTNSYLEAAILNIVADLAVDVSQQTFEDVISTFTSLTKTATLELTTNDSKDVFQLGIFRAQAKLSKNLCEQENFSEIYLMELLRLFIDKGQAIQSAHTALPSFPHLINHLGVLVPLIANLLHPDGSYNPRKTSSLKLSELFRNFWYVCVLFGFLSSTSPPRTTAGNASVPPDWLIESLRQIATKSPTLTHLTSINYVTTELDYNPILKFPDPPVSTTPSKSKQNHAHVPSPHQIALDQAKKQELASLIPTHSGQIKSLNFIQTIFLLTTARLEIFRAEDCRAYNILEYFNHVSPDEVDVHNLFGCLVTISEKVLGAFISSFQQHAIRHAEVPHVHDQIPEVLKFTCHPTTRIRVIALRYCQDMIIAFPTLVCDFDTVLTMLELITLLRISCEGEYEDEYSPKYEFYSERADLTIELIDDYAVRQQILNDLCRSVKNWLSIALARAPLEMKSIFLRYLDAVTSPISMNPIGNIEMGKSIALEMAKMIPSNSQLSYLPSWGNWAPDLSNDLARSFSNRMFYNGQAIHLSSLPENECQARLEECRAELKQIMRQLTTGGKKTSITQLSSALYRAGSHVIASPKPDLELLQRLVSLPIRMFTPLSVSLGLEVWTWLIDVKPEVETKLITEVMTMWNWTHRRRKGLFSNSLDSTNPLNQSIQFNPTDRDEMHHHLNSIKRMLKPHSILLDFLSSRFQAARYQNRNLVMATMRFLRESFENVSDWCKHPLSRELRIRLLIFGFSICQGSRMEDNVEHLLRDLCYHASFDWFSLTSSFGFGSNRLQHESELRLLQELLEMVKVDIPVNAYHLSSIESNTNLRLLPGRLTPSAASLAHTDRNRLLQLFLENEIIRLMVWHNPLNDPKKGKDIEANLSKLKGEAEVKLMVQTAWSINPHLALRLAERFKNVYIEDETRSLVRRYPHQARKVPEALDYFAQPFDPAIIPNLHQILYWKKTPVMTALTYFLPQYDNDPILLQYAMRVLEEHPVDVTFFYIPQVVQALRTDTLGYVERFICETAQVSQLFCHQIIWNMKANTYKGDDATEADSLKPTLDRIMESIISSLSGEAKTFYETEFTFFDEVTSISKTLKDYLKKDKAEKKAKIAEELAKIKLPKGVYLPSNPDGTVVDIDRTSGRPLQSHAKTPFMATFKVHREKTVHLDDDGNDVEEAHDVTKAVDTWQAAIFKVGDDCRQDVLALQLIAIHKTMYESMCVDLHLVPYRVTATAPGCGVIDVIPDATSRDEMGRAKINDLTSFFIGKFGPVDSIGFQTARMNFIRSMAAYSVMCYLIQIKDRHNGNIMINGQGHVTHIDFGFLFDIGPGGIKFEPNSFKLTGEMIALMGGQNSAGFRAFQELVIKGFLISRPFFKEIVTCVKLMSDTQLPSFKGESTITKFIERFKPNLSDREAAVFMQSVISNAKQNGLSLLYDEFQWVTNEIPYTQKDWITRPS
ncbi:phosphatidylinositol-4- kinase [Puccinia graminis f. sp. tritici]|uniref:1-phosphatidylinositol 4-kinase n=2 Tax=Puccinia graminis f. sp. tritici TaxID=56615 RepID=E3KGR1_PUCGT|nr:uncharacterized protein PGTG_08672 [Puccinia graminis f. sp. tritici CRL 75-36-700-3]EFP83486.2 hypothetical protein PGTG_08672 [Puccinia graminis f. sp. tritici CRL 75-36-700-3]KAA1078049.1 phosphatidylinositol-4- kinase [Puccinia graminis f. sp. tritici]